MINEFYHYRPSQIIFFIISFGLTSLIFYHIGRYYFDNDDIEKAYKVIETYIIYELKTESRNKGQSGISYCESDYEDREKLRNALTRKRVKKGHEKNNKKVYEKNYDNTNILHDLREYVKDNSDKHEIKKNIKMIKPNKYYFDKNTMIENDIYFDFLKIPQQG